MGIYFNENGNVYLDGNKPIIGSPILDTIIDWWKLDENVIGEVNGYTGSTGGVFVDNRYLNVSNSTLNLLNIFSGFTPTTQQDWTFSFFIKGSNYRISIEDIWSTGETTHCFYFIPVETVVNGQPVRAEGIMQSIGNTYFVREENVDWFNWTYWTWQMYFTGLNRGELSCLRDGVRIYSAPFDYFYEPGGSSMYWNGIFCSGSDLQLRDITLYHKIQSDAEVLYNYNALK